MGRLFFTNSLTNQYNSYTDLLTKAKDLFQELKSSYPNRKVYKALFNNAERKIAFNAGNNDARSNGAVKNHKKQNKQKHKDRFNGKSLVKIQGKLDELLAKPAHPERIRYIKELYRTIIAKKKKTNKFNHAYDFALELYNYDHYDSLSLKEVKKLAIINDEIESLIDICFANDVIKQTFWSKLGLFDAKYKGYISGMISHGEMLALYAEMAQLSNNILQQKIECITRRFRLELFENDFIAAKATLIELGDMLANPSNAHIAIRFTTLAARFFAKNNEFGNALECVQIAQSAPSAENTYTNELLSTTFEVNKNVILVKEAHLNRLDDIVDILNDGEIP